MAWDLNQVVLIGRLTRDPELRYSQNGLAICSFSLAVNRKSSRDGAEDQVYFFNIKAFGKTAETTSQYLTKGKRVGVQGHLQQNRWEDQNGQKRSTVDIVADRVQFLDPSSGNAAYQTQSADQPDSHQNSPEAPSANKMDESFPENDDDIPF